METVWRDIRYALRSLRRSRSFAVVAIACLALGIGATTTIFSLVNALFLQPMPFAHPDGLVRVTEYWRQFGSEDGFVAPLNVLDWTADSGIFRGTALLRTTGLNLGGGDVTEHVGGTAVTPNFFALLGVRPELGRTFIAGEGVAGEITWWC